MFGNGVCTYMTSPMTSGAPSWPRSTPVENVHATCNLPTLPVLICLSVEYRVLAKSFAGIAQSFAFCAYRGPAATSAAALITVPIVSEKQRIVHPPCDTVIRVHR